MELKKQLRKRQTGSFALLDSLVRNGVKVVFGYPGGAILPIYDELYLWEKEGLIEHILVRHEQGAAHAADAFSRSTGKVGVCFGTSGPGATNLVTGIATAEIDSIPMIIVTGQVGRQFIGTNAFQEVDIYGITLPIVKHSYIVTDVNSILNIVSEAFYLAKNGRPGPVLIDIPKDVGLEEIEKYKPIYQYQIARHRRSDFCFQLQRRQIKIALNLLRQSSQPLLYVGGGAIIANAREELTEISERFEIPVTTTLMGKGAFQETHTLYLGMLGMHGTAYANFAVSQCDLLIAVGARFDDRVTGKLEDFACQAQILQIEIDPKEIGKNKIPHLALLGDIKKVLLHLLRHSEINQAYDKTQTKFWRERILKWKEKYPLIVPQISKGIVPQQIISHLAALLPNAYFTTDVGQHQMWAAQFLRCSHRKWLSSASLGTMGYGLPAAIGAQLAHKDSTVICISGDASFQMNLQELGTIAQYNLPVKIFILNNKWQGMVRQWQQSFYEGRYSHSSMREGMPDFVALANSYGIRGFNLNQMDQLLRFDETLFTDKKPLLINFDVREDENCYPMVAPGKSNSQMLGLTNEASASPTVKRSYIS